LKPRFIKPVLVLSSIYILIYFALASGIVNSIIEGQNYNQAIFLPSRAVQNNYETAIGIIVLVSGFIGTLIAVKGLNVEKLYEKYALLGSGFMIVMISLIFMYKVMELKA
jgi:ABC-type cobalamin transport system permease subunit